MIHQVSIKNHRPHQKLLENIFFYYEHTPTFYFVVILKP